MRTVVTCRSCRADTGDLVLDLGSQPACEYFPRLDEPAADPVFPLRLWLCAACGLAQLADDATLPDQPEGVEPAALRAQRQAAVAAVHAADLLRPGMTVAEGATPHGGSWLSLLAERGLVPAAESALADVVVDGSFGLMHAVDQGAELDALVARLAPGGVLLFQFHSLGAILAAGEWNAVRHGHYAYYSAPSAVRMLAARGLVVSRAWSFPLYGGTVLLAASRDGLADGSVEAVTAAETAAGVLDPVALKSLQVAVDTSTAALRAAFDGARARGSRVYGYAAASRAVGLLFAAGIEPDQLLGVADASPAKQGCRMPGTRIPIISPKELALAKPDLVMTFVTDVRAEAEVAVPEVAQHGGVWIEVGEVT